MSEPLAFEFELSLPYQEALDRVIGELKEEGFGVLTRIDVDVTLKEKIDVDFRPYAILGACNPKLAHRALSARPEVGLMLPCNVVVEAPDANRSLVRIINPREMMRAAGLEKDPVVCEVGEEAYAGLARVAQRLQEA